MDEQTQLELEAATFRRCSPSSPDSSACCTRTISRASPGLPGAGGYREGVPLDYDGARELSYGMPYDDWKRQNQAPATAEQQAKFAAREAAENAAK